MAQTKQPSLKETRENIRQDVASTYEGPRLVKMIERMTPQNTDRRTRRLYFVALRRVNAASVAHLIDHSRDRRVYHMVKGKTVDQYKAEKAQKDTVAGILSMAKAEQAKAEHDIKRHI